MRRLLLVLGLVLLLAVPLAEARSTAVPYAGFYDCRGLDGFTHVGDILLRMNGTYVTGYVDNSGRRFKRVTGRGSFSRSGSRLTFRSGPLRPMYAIVRTPSRFGVWARGERNYSYYCYYTSRNRPS